MCTCHEIIISYMISWGTKVPDAARPLVWLPFSGTTIRGHLADRVGTTGRHK